MKEIKIYGEIVPFQDDWIIANGYCNLTHVQNQLKEANGEDVRVRINSFGGDVEEGFAIYNELRRYAKENEAKINMLAEGRCASIATVIFLAGDERLIGEYMEPFFHDAWTYAIGNSKQIQRIVADLERCNEKIAKHYEAHTELTYDEARALMDEETSLSASECVKIRFATALEELPRPVALQGILNRNVKLNRGKMAGKNKEATSLLNKIVTLLTDSGAKALEVYTDDQKVLDFYELEEGDTPTVGDKANFDGQPAQGSYKIASTGETYVFGNGTTGELTEIQAAETEEEESELARLREENAELRKKVESNEASVAALAKKVEEFEGVWNSLKAAASEVEIDDKDDEPKGGQQPRKEGGLSAALKNRNK